MMIRYLESGERTGCRALWEEAFPEDSKAFGDYYFSEKVRDNRILVMEEDGRIVSMLHQNPYRLHAGSQMWLADYIVGVATAADWRRRGCMRSLLTRMMREQYGERMPFCFLMPADQAIYRPFGFAWIFDQPRWELRPEAEERLARQTVPPDGDRPGYQGYLAGAAAWMERWLGERYEVYAVRDEAYLRRLLLELDSEDGSFEALYDQNGMAGVRAEWGLTEREQRLLLAAPGYIREAALPKPAIMARIICLEEFVRAVHLRGDGGAGGGEVTVRLAVDDPLIPGNAGLWLWHLTRETSWLERETCAGPGVSAGPELALTVTELTSWLFGYGTPEAAAAYADVVQPLRGVFLDEVV